jgi:4-hydroxybenzoyl-CoA reductase subunit beta
MMRCPPFRFVAPRTVEEVAAVLHAEGQGATILAGGTDVLPGMKRRTQTPAVLVSLRRVEGLRGVRLDGGDRAARVLLGAGTTLTDVAAEPRLRPYGALVRAAAQVASPPIRNAATVGGNLCLDTRCNYYDQNHEWRKAVDFCMKRDGETCWVAPGSPRCWAVSSTDLAPALIALGARVRLQSTQGFRDLDLEHLYKDDGIAFLAKRHDELVVDVRLPDAAGLRSTYWKLRRREAFDFPVLGVGAALRLDEKTRVVTSARLVLGAVGSRPVLVEEAAAALVGKPLTDDAIEACADAASRFAKPLDNTDFAITWRKRVARTFIAGALRELRGDDPAALGLLARRAAHVALPVLPPA